MVEVLFSLFFVTSFLGRLYLSIRPAERLWPYMASAVTMTVVGVLIIVLTDNPLIYATALLILGIPTEPPTHSPWSPYPGPSSRSIGMPRIAYLLIHDAHRNCDAHNNGLHSRPNRY
ncbi:hypothetical protein [Vulcanisaeta sp. JCM 14467]|uniref:hypothetical protein n=1 Tax=Vulcanisaeta sp. JCM 14467 TaxID=1295370 RepID=UPI000B29F25F|nr:hypothetical protein [Vulcanisaeta sp. JCM 14467]